MRRYINKCIFRRINDRSEFLIAYCGPRDIFPCEVIRHSFRSIKNEIGKLFKTKTSCITYFQMYNNGDFDILIAILRFI